MFHARGDVHTALAETELRELGKHISGKMQVSALTSPGPHRCSPSFLWEVVSLIVHRHNFCCLARKGIKSWGKQIGQPESIGFWISDIPKQEFRSWSQNQNRESPRAKD